MNNKKSKLTTMLTIILTAGGIEMARATEVDIQVVKAVEEKSIELIEVVGFRGSLNRALFEKRNSVNSKESIMSEDIGKFPDLNITESLQRVPGVSISREGGEGRQVTLRGLSPSFTRSTLNGMEVPGSTDGTDSGGSVNTGRAFDFNIFASELFNRVDIQKTPTASMEEGGIAGTIDLYSAKPFDQTDFQFSTSVVAGYNEVAKEVDPRIAFVISNTFADDTFGALLSISKSERSVRQEGYGTVRWTNPVADGAGTFADTSNLVMTGAMPQSCSDKAGATVHAANCLWTPRLPRPDFFGNEQDRLGITSSFQWALNEATILTFDTLHSTLDNQRTMYNFFEMFRSSFANITPTAITVAPNGKQVVAGTYTGVKSRIESRQQISKTDFSQYVLSGQFDVTNNLTVHALIGTAESDSRSEQRRYNMTTHDAHTFSFDFSDNANVPVVNHGYEVNDSMGYNLTDGRLRAIDTLRKNDTAKIDLTYVASAVTIKSGFAYNDRYVGLNVEELRGFDDQASAFGFTTDFPHADFGSGFDGPLNSFMVADFAEIAPLLPTQWSLRAADTWRVQEKTSAFYLELNSDYEISDMILRSNFGMRYVETTTNSTGYLTTDIGVDKVSIEERYKNFLPALNLALSATDEIVLRLGISKTMTRPSLGSLNPGAPEFDYINGTVKVGNPSLEPFTANNVDLGIEWYLNDESMLAATYFYKEIETFITNDIEKRLVDPAYHAFINADGEYEAGISLDPFTTPYEHSTPVNGKGTNIEGLEIIYQQPLSFLSAPFDGLGIIVNYTHVSANEITGLSKNTYNATLYYEKENYGARISINKRDDYITAYLGSNGNAEHGTTGPTHVDFSSFYNITNQITATFEVVNITDEYERLYTTGDGSLDLMREYNHTGRQFFLGARYTF